MQALGLLQESLINVFLVNEEGLKRVRVKQSSSAEGGEVSAAVVSH